MLTPFERAVLGNMDITYGQQRRLVRAINQYRDLDSSDREYFVAPYRRWGAPIRSWVLLRLSVDNPRLVVLGPVMAAGLYSYLLAFFIFKMVK